MNHCYLNALNSHIFVPNGNSEDNMTTFFKAIRQETHWSGDWERPFAKEDITTGSLSSQEIKELVGDKQLKYVTFKKGDTIFPIVFSEDIQHSFLDEAVFHLEEDYCEPYSAGFVLIGSKSSSVFGRSESMDLDSQSGHDVRLINNLLF